METCPFATYDGDHSIHCASLKRSGAKWDLCIHQYFCRTKAKYKMNEEAQKCKIREEGE